MSITYSYSSGYGSFTSPLDGYWDITAQGAGGGGLTTITSKVGGYGAFQVTRFHFTQGSQVTFFVGAAGTGGKYSGGGGGASWVVGSYYSGRPLVVAGGGGGASRRCSGLSPTASGSDGVSTGCSNACVGGSGGSSGTIRYGGGGGGWNSAGTCSDPGSGLASTSLRGKGGNALVWGYSPGVQQGSGQFGGCGGFGGGGAGSYYRRKASFTSSSFSILAGGGGGGGGWCGGHGGNIGVTPVTGGGGGTSYAGNGSYFSCKPYGTGEVQSYGTATSRSGLVSFTYFGLTCYLPGTLILTTRGEVAVEDLKIGDLLPTLSGEKVPIKWVGVQQFMGQYATKDASPVRFHMGSLGNGLPKRDLYVSAGHSMKIGEHLVDARLLVNGVTITQHQRFEQLAYYHIDLGEHHCILAEGAWSESYLECNANRETFVNADEFFDKYPYHLTNSLLEKCLPHVADYQDPRHAALFKTLLTHIPQDLVTTDPDLHLLADDLRIDPDELIPQAYKFNIPAGTKVLRLKSRTSSPCELGLPSDDRRLGFCLQSLAAEAADGTGRVTVGPDSTTLSEGFHQAEGTARRWTQGDALLPALLMGNGTQDIILTVKGRALARYHLGGVEGQQSKPVAKLRIACQPVEVASALG